MQMGIVAGLPEASDTPATTILSQGKWLAVSTESFSEQQHGRPLEHLLKELVQNAMDDVGHSGRIDLDIQPASPRRATTRHAYDGPGDLYDEHVARLEACVAMAHPDGDVLLFNKLVSWRPEQGPGGLLWWDKAWSDFVLRPGSGLEDVLAQRGRDLAHPDAHTVTAFGFVGAFGLFHSLAACLDGLEPDEGDVRFFRSASG